MGYALPSWPLAFCKKLFASSYGDRSSSHPLLAHRPPKIHGGPSPPATTPFAVAGFFSRMTFWWLNPLFALGFQRPLQPTDLPRLGPQELAETAYDRFARAWERQKLLSPSTQPSVSRVLVSCCWKDVIKNAFFALVKTITLAAGPLVLNSFIKCAAGNQLFKYEGYVLVALLFLAKLLESLSQRQWFFGSRRIGLRLRSALIGAIYQKQLRLSNEGRQRHAAGEIVNYMSVDAYRIGEYPYWMHQLWTTPLLVVCAMGILFYAVGWATLAGVGVIVLTVLANSPLARFQQKFQTQLMDAQDERLRATAESLQNMKILKLQAWEDQFKSSIEQLREVEYKWLSGVQYRKTFNTIIFWISPVMVSSATFLACYLMGTPLTPSNIFTSLATLRILQEPVRSAPDLVAVLIQAKVSLARIATFLAEEELQSDAVHEASKGSSDYAVKIEGASFSWDPCLSKPTLRNMNVGVKHGQRLAVCGEVGAGKSTLLCAILGEVPKIAGTLKVCGSIAYVSQTAWIQSGTIQDNVLFGRPMDKKRYEETLRACELDKDIESFPFRDLTEIGERGINMSGGQKQRIQLARAVYQDADIYLLDDPFSAVDAHTATSLFKGCIMGALSNKTVILVTHQVEFLPAFDCILLMQGGEIRQAGCYNELLQSGSAFEKLINAHEESVGAKPLDGSGGHTKTKPLPISAKLKKQLSKATSIEDSREATDAVICEQLTKEEESEAGVASIKALVDYLGQNKGFVYCSLATVFQLLFALGQVGSNTWMAAKVDDSTIGTAILIAVYSTIGLTSIFFLFFRSIFVVHMGLSASRSFFTVLMNSLYRAPMAFFDSTPTGRILTRVSSDLSILDIDFPFSLIFSISASINSLSNLVVTIAVTWQILIIIVPMLYLSWRLQDYYIATAKELMRINGTTKSPIANFFGESISGAITIRAFKLQDDFMNKVLTLVDDNSSPFFHTFAANEWMIQRLEAFCATVLCSSALIMTLLPAGSVQPGFVGLALTYGLSLNMSLATSMQNQCILANYFVSVERIKQYMYVPSEAPVLIEGNRPPQSWPSKGHVELRNLQVRYRPKSPLVLRGITCTFEGGQKVGVVGRTGSGKTTLISALFRLIEPAGGRILIDGIDITTIGLHDLRSRLGIIPQEPTLFRGTVRFNLDPLSQYSDSKIWETLDKCQLGSIIRQKPEKLDAPVGDEGANWSVGQRQLFGLGRALLKCSRILVLDEATASIDNATDSVIQKIIHEDFTGCTVVTVAHRIPTVVDSDMVLALSDGALVEYDQPIRLLQNKTSLFAKLVAEYWSRTQNAIASG